MQVDTIYNEECLEGMNRIEDHSIDMILCDLPYGTTACKWDIIIPFEPLWKQYKRVIKKGGAIVLFGSEPFSSHLRLSNIKDYKYDWIWNKKLAGNGILAKKQPLKIHEIVSVFNSSVYIPQKEIRGKPRVKLTNNLKVSEINNGDGIKHANETYNNEYYPTSIQEFTLANLRRGRLHPTQKPVALMEYLIRTYTNEGEIVLDNCIGSGTTAIAAINTNRHYVGYELDALYYQVAIERIQKHNASR